MSSSSRKSVVTSSRKMTSSGGGGSTYGKSFGSCIPRQYSARSMINLTSSPVMSSSYSVKGSFGGRRLGMGMGMGMSSGYGMGIAAGGCYGGGMSMSSMLGGQVVGNEKDTMQNLNERLATYLSKVQSLQDSNRHLEKKIREASSGSSIEGFDWSIYDTTVKPLQLQIQAAIMTSARVALEIDNAKLAAEDFRNKWEHELMLRQSVENDINGLIQLKGTYEQLQSGLLNDIATLEDEIAYMRKNHAEEVKILRQQKSSEIQVEVDARPSVNLQDVLNQIRNDYNSVSQKNQAEMENWYKIQLETKTVEQVQGNQAYDAAKAELTEYRRQMQTLQAEYDALLSSINSLEAALRDTEMRCDQEMQSYMFMVSSLEGELMRIRNEINQQAQNYQQLLNIKMKLEQEISMYRQLLDGSGQSLTGISGSSSGSGSSSMVSGGGSGSQIITSTTTTTSKESKLHY